MRRTITSAVAAGALVLGVSAIPAAAALTDSGTITCSHGAKRAVIGEQQRLYDWLTVAVGGQSRTETNVYTLGIVANNGGTSTWSATSLSLLLSGTGGYCQPL